MQITDFKESAGHFLSAWVLIDLRMLVSPDKHLTILTAAIIKQFCGRQPASYWWLLKWKYGTFPLFSAALHRINCRIHTEILTFAHITGACCCFLYRSSSHRLLWHPFCTWRSVETSVFFRGRLIRGTAEGRWKLQMKRNTVQREGRQ